MSQPLKRFAGHHPIVLIVDDNPAIRDMVSWALELDGFEPAEATEGSEALAWMANAAREGRYPSVILLDLAMPGMDGHEFLQRLHERGETTYPSPAIVVITAASSSSKTVDLRVEHVMVKPFHVRDLLDVVRKFTT